MDYITAFKKSLREHKRRENEIKERLSTMRMQYKHSEPQDNYMRTRLENEGHRLNTELAALRELILECEHAVLRWGDMTSLEIQQLTGRKVNV